VNGHTDTCEFLLEKGSDINEKKNNGSTLLHFGEYLSNIKFSSKVS
jgi:ankyrin repeat protein